MKASKTFTFRSVFGFCRNWKFDILELRRSLYGTQLVLVSLLAHALDVCRGRRGINRMHNSCSGCVREGCSLGLANNYTTIKSPAMFYFIQSCFVLLSRSLEENYNWLEATGTVDGTLHFFWCWFHHRYELDLDYWSRPPSEGLHLPWSSGWNTSLLLNGSSCCADRPNCRDDSRISNSCQ